MEPGFGNRDSGFGRGGIQALTSQSFPLVDSCDGNKASLKTPDCSNSVIPAKAGIHCAQHVAWKMDAGFCREDRLFGVAFSALILRAVRGMNQVGKEARR